MENDQLETTGTGRRKPRISKGKLKKSVAKKNKRFSQGFSSSFTQKTLHNNTLLAQSLAKEKSRNEKFLVLHRELMTSRNEALMRLNETESSFDRLGMLVQKSLKQMQQVVSTLGDMFVEIRTSKNNPRDSASMRSSWDETVTSVGRTIIPPQLVRINGMQENVGVNDHSPQYSLRSTSLQPVSPIKEELEMMCDEDEIRDNSLLCRKLAPTPLQSRNNMKEVYEQIYAQDPQEGGSSKGVRGPVKVPRKINMVWGLNLVETSPFEDRDVNRTSVSVVDMEETVVEERTTSVSSPFNTDGPDSGLSEDLSYEQVFCRDKTDSEIPGPTNTLFNTVRLAKRPNNNSPDNLSYEQVFCRDKTDSEIPGPTNTPFNTVRPARRPNNGSPDDLSYEQVFCPAKTDSEMPRSGLGNAASGKRAAPPHTNCGSDSPDFLGFSFDNTESTNRVRPYCDSLDEESTLVASSPEIRLCKKPCNRGWSSSDDEPISQKNVRNGSPGLVQKPNSKILKVTPSSSENVFNSGPSKKAVQNSKKSKLTKNPDPDLAVNYPSTPSLSKTVKTLRVNNLPEFTNDFPDVDKPISQKNVHNGSPGLVQKPNSKISKVTPSWSENVFNSGPSKKAVQNSKKSKLTKNPDPDSAVDNPSTAKTPSLYKTAIIQQANNLPEHSNDFPDVSSDDEMISQKNTHNESPGLVQKPNSKSSKVTPSASENVLNSGTSKKAVHNPKKSKSKPTQNPDPDSAVDNPSTAKTPSQSKTANTQQANSSAVRSDNLPKSSGAAQGASKCLPTTTGDGEVATKRNSVASSTILSSTPLQTASCIKVTSEVPGNPRTARLPTVAPVKSARNKTSKSKAKRLRLPTKPAVGSPAITPDFARAKETPLETKSADEWPRAATKKAESADAVSKSADAGQRAKRPRVGRQGLDTDVEVTESLPHTHSWKRLRQGTPLAPDANETPSRGSRAKTPNVLALVNKLQESSLSRTSEPEGSERRILSRRKATHSNYKEPSLISKIRQPGRKDQV